MTTASVTHTPGPWATAGISNPQTNPRMSVWGPKAPDAQSGEWIAKDIRPANAEFIVRACNAHDDLVAALKDVLAQFETGAFVRNTDSDGCSDWALKAAGPLRALAVAQKAVAKAEGR